MEGSSLHGSLHAAQQQGKAHRERAVERAVASMLDVVEELAMGLAHGQTPEPEWAQIVQDTFDKHRRELRGEEIEWEGS